RQCRGKFSNGAEVAGSSAREYVSGFGGARLRYSTWKQASRLWLRARAGVSLRTNPVVLWRLRPDLSFASILRKGCRARASVRWQQRHAIPRPTGRRQHYDRPRLAGAVAAIG